jgi:hypothetical protein
VLLPSRTCAQRRRCSASCRASASPRLSGCFGNLRRAGCTVRRLRAGDRLVLVHGALLRISAHSAHLCSCRLPCPCHPQTEQSRSTPLSSGFRQRSCPYSCASRVMGSCGQSITPRLAASVREPFVASGSHKARGSAATRCSDGGVAQPLRGLICLLRQQRPQRA